jgi:CBS domain-containing protein
VKKYTAKDLMVPISEYATVSEGATLFEAVLALEKAQEDFEHTQYSHRAVLVLDKDKRVVGKLSQLDFLQIFEREDELSGENGDISKFGFGGKAIIAHKEKFRNKGASMEKILSRAARLNVEDFMQSPSEGEYIEEDTFMDIAVHQLVSGTHLSLLVVRDKEIVGVLRLSDVFGAVFHAMKESELLSL